MNKQKGFSLIELLVAAVIGLFLMASLVNLFITTNRSITLSEALSQNQEAGRFALDYMTRFIRLSGYTSNSDVQYIPSILTPTGLALGGQLPCPDGACSENNPVDAFGDRLSIPFVSDDNVKRSCTGTEVPIDTQLSNVFWVSNEEDTKNELRCQTYNYETGSWIDTSPVSIVNNIESFEFLIGVASDKSDKNASRYINVQTLNDSGLNLIDQIRSFRIAILTTSQDELTENKKKTNIQERKYSVLDGPLFEKTDGNLRQIFSNTIELPSMISDSVNH